MRHFDRFTGFDNLYRGMRGYLIVKFFFINVMKLLKFHGQFLYSHN